MQIDIHTHAHFKRHAGISFRVKNDAGMAFEAAGQFPTPEKLIEIMDAMGTDKSVLLCIVSPECMHTPTLTEETLQICAQYPDRLIPFCGVDPRYLRNSPTANFAPLLNAFMELGCKGVGEYTPHIPLDDPLNMNLFAQIEEAGLPLTFHLAPEQGPYYGGIDEVGLPRLEKVLKTFPNLIFLGHSQVFWAEISTDVIQHGERARYPTGPVTPGRIVELMREYPNLHGDVSAGSGFTALSRDPEFGYGFLEEFQDKLYWGTDIARMDGPLARGEEPLPYEEWFQKKWRIFPYFQKLKQKKLISTEAYEKITWRNANRLLGLRLEGND